MKPARFVPIVFCLALAFSTRCVHAQESAPSQTPVLLVEKAARIVKRETGIAPTLQVKLRTDKPVYRAGELLQAYVTVPPHSHIRLYYRDAEGNVTVLFPNEFSPDSQVAGGAEMPVPAASDQWDIQIEAAPSGTEYLAVLASEHPFVDAPELAAAIKRDGGQARMGNQLIEEVVGKGPRAMLSAPAIPLAPPSPPLTPPKTAEPLPAITGNLGIAIVQIQTSK